MTYNIVDKKISEMPPYYTIAFFLDFDCCMSDAAAMEIGRILRSKDKMELLRETTGWSVCFPQAVLINGAMHLFVKENGNSKASLDNIAAAIRNLRDYLEWTDSSIDMLLVPVADGYDSHSCEDIANLFAEALEYNDVEVVFCSA